MKQIATCFGVFLIAVFGSLLLFFLRVCGAHLKRQKLQVACFRAILKCWNVSLRVKGELQVSPALVVANHCSYVDVAVLGSLASMRFTPKSEVKHWPLIGRIVQAFDVIFVDRVPGKAKQAQQALLQALKEGHRICVFPEGTTNNGRELKPFKPSLFSLAEHWDDGDLTVQPVVVRYQKLNGKPMDDDAWDRVAWYGDEGLIPHLWAFCGIKSLEVRVECLTPLNIKDFGDRKALCAGAREQMLIKLPHIKESIQENT